MKDLRTGEYDAIYKTDHLGDEYIAVYSSLDYAQTEAIINICRTSFVYLVLSLASIYFTKDA